MAYDNVSRPARAGFVAFSAAFSALFSAPLSAHMSLNPEEVRRIARLARLELSPDETGRTRDQLNGILAFIEQLQAVDTSDIAPMAHAMDIAQRLRTDAVSEPDRRDAFQALAPETEAGLYLVPKVIE